MYKCVIVESPSKCKKIEEYLGSNYKCIASYGHLRELNHTMKYTNIDSKKKQIDLIKKTIKSSSEVILATDKDREGEAIAWHICDMFNLPIKTTKRITFSSITKEAILESIQSPGLIDMKLVESQKTRQMLDITIGYKISPVLWKKITTKMKLSAGRCQIPALKIIYDNENIDDTSNLEYKTIGYFTEKCIPFQLNHKIQTFQEANDFLENSKNKKYILNVRDMGIHRHKSPLPLSTSRIQQLSNQRLTISPKDTMSICQSLYEKGLITYMRTDTLCYSKNFINEMKQYIKNTIHCEVRENLLDITMNDSEPHESIRPTKITNEIQLIGNEKRVYQLIKDITIESFLEDCLYHKYDFFTNINKYKYNHQVDVILKKGWKYKDIIKDDYSYLSLLINKSISCNHIVCEESLYKKKQHYTESKLIQILEEKGIGRPSTFANILETIKTRGYVKKMNIKGVEQDFNKCELIDNIITNSNVKKKTGEERNKLVLQTIGKMVIDILYNDFNTLFDYNYTKHMEEELDLIMKGQRTSTDVIQELDATLKKQFENLDTSKIKIEIDDEHTCIIGKYGPIIQKKNGDFLKIKEGIDIEDIQKYSIEDLLHEDVQCGTYNGLPMIIKSGKYGKYLDVNGLRYPLKNNDLDQNEEYYIDLIKNKRVTNYHRELSDEMSIKNGKYGYYICFKCKKKNISLKKFPGDIHSCTIEELNKWIDNI